MINVKRSLGLAVAAATAVTGLAFAHSGATGIVKFRMDAMKSVARSMKALNRLDWSDTDAVRAVVAENAQNVQRHAAEIVDLFPEGSIMGPSEAVPAIWEKPDEFAALARKLEMAASDLATAAPDVKGAVDIKPYLETMGGTCKGCHEGFRVKK